MEILIDSKKLKSGWRSNNFFTQSGILFNWKMVYFWVDKYKKGIKEEELKEVDIYYDRVKGEMLISFNINGNVNE